MKANELRRMYIEFFKEKGHKEIASASLLPENDPTVLFTTAGMHPLVPYLLGEKHPQGQRLTDVQKCVRTGDIDEVGDNMHLTFFEMLGNWSLGDYFKKDAIAFSYEFLIYKLNIPIEKLAVTVFEGDESVARDIEAANFWMENGLKENQIFYYGREENWWGPAGQVGPCGPDTEIFYDTGKQKCSSQCGPACNCGKYVEIWNNVFMQYNKDEDGKFSELNQKNVDTGMGFERVLTILNNVDSVYDTELFLPIMEYLDQILSKWSAELSLRNRRIVCEHIRTISFILGDPKRIVPSNTEQGYILRRLIRRVIRLLKKAGVVENELCGLATIILDQYGEVYSELKENKIFVLSEIQKEYNLFSKTLDTGLKKAENYFNELEAGGVLCGDLAFKLYDTFGFPIEFTSEIAKEKGYRVDLDGFRKKFEEHQEKSRQGAEGKFKGGLADNSEQTTRLHTATHLLNGALRTVLGESIYQRGSNITAERLRFDFSFDRKVTSDELARITRIVNEAISKEIDVSCEEMTIEQALDSGAIGVFEKKYGERVKVYTISGYSKEICGGPHVTNTRELGNFRILKEESSSSGVRRIKAVLEDN